MVAAGLNRDEALHAVQETSRHWRHDVIPGLTRDPLVLWGFKKGRSRLKAGMTGWLEGAQFALIADDPVHFRHHLERLAIEFGGAASHQDLRAGPLAACVPDRLASLPHRFIRHRAAVDHNPIFAGRSGARNCLALREIEAAAERDRLDAHVRASKSRSPLKTCVALPRMRI